MLIWYSIPEVSPVRLYRVRASIFVALVLMAIQYTKSINIPSNTPQILMQMQWQGMAMVSG